MCLWALGVIGRDVRELVAAVSPWKAKRLSKAKQPRRPADWWRRGDDSLCPAFILFRGPPGSGAFRRKPQPFTGRDLWDTLGSAQTRSGLCPDLLKGLCPLRIPAKEPEVPWILPSAAALGAGSFRSYFIHLLNASSSLSISTGLATWSFMPASLASRMSSAKALAVMAMMGTRFASSRSRARMARAAS